MGLRDEKLLQELFDQLYDQFEYWADVKIEEITKPNTREGFATAERKALKTLVATDIGKTALYKLLFACSESNMFSTFTYIDGGTGIKPLELTNAHTRMPIAENTLHEYFSDYRREFKRLNG